MDTATMEIQWIPIRSGDIRPGKVERGRQIARFDDRQLETLLRIAMDRLMESLMEERAK